MPHAELRSLLRDIVEQITVAADRIEIRIKRANVAAALQARGLRQQPDLDPVILSIEAKLRRAGKGKRLVIQNGVEAEINEGLVALIKEAFAVRNQLLSGSDGSIESMSGRLTMNKGRLTSLVRLSYLAPDIVRAFLAGRQPIALTPTALLRLSKDLPDDWKEQRCFLGSPPKPPAETLHIRQLENGLERPGGRLRPASRGLASLVDVDAFAGELTRGSFKTIPASEETSDLRRIPG